MEILLLVFYVVTDALRDVYSYLWFNQKTKWIKFHVIKWLNFYPIAIYLFLKTQPDFLYGLSLIAVLWFLWWLMIIIKGMPWRPFWAKWL